MAGFMDTLGRRPDYDNSSSYQKMMLREISKKLLDLEALNEQNHASVEELRRLQKNLLTKMEAMEMNRALEPGRGGSADSVKSDVRTLSDQVRSQLRQLSEMVGKDIQGMSGQIRQMEERLSALEEHVGGFGQQVAGVREEMEALSGGMASVQEEVRSGQEAVREGIQSLAQAASEQDEQAGQAQEPALESLETLKLSLEDTIHKESIKCFRNVQGALEEQGDGKEQDSRGMRRYMKVIIWFQLVTIALVVLQILGLL